MLTLVSGMVAGKDTIHTVFGTRVAVLAGDFMFAQSSWYLANLDNLEVIKLISQVMAIFPCLQFSLFINLFIFANFANVKMGWQFRTRQHGEAELLTLIGYVLHR